MPDNDEEEKGVKRERRNQKLVEKKDEMEELHLNAIK